MPYQIILADFSAGWPIGRVIEHNTSGMRAEIGAVSDSGWWVFTLTQRGRRAQKAGVNGVPPKAFNVFPVIACSEWHYFTMRPKQHVPGRCTCWPASDGSLPPTQPHGPETVTCLSCGEPRG